MKKRIAYIMHVDWGWIKQRPHFLAEKLSKWYYIDLFFIQNIKKEKLVENNRETHFSSVKQIKRLPLSGRIRLFRMIEGLINLNSLRELYKKKYDYVWITSPFILQFINLGKLTSSKIIYDCMDDILAFPQSSYNLKYMAELEKKLIGFSDIIFVSSSNLKDKMICRGATSKIHVINNAIEPKSLLTSFDENRLVVKKNDYFSILYFGTVAKWFDFDLVLQVLLTYADVEFIIIGPIETRIPTHPRLKILGPVQHEKLGEYALCADAFIMPFKVNDLILSVDPVKVYEYLAFLKPCFIINYPETEKFSEYVYLYKDFQELSSLISQIKETKQLKKSKGEVMEFMNCNTWDIRVDEVYKILEEY